MEYGKTSGPKTGRPFMRGAPPPARARRTLACVAATALLLLLVAPIFGDNGLRSYLRLNSEKTELENEVEALQSRQALQEAEIDALRNDPEALERMARERYGMRKPNEKVLEVVVEEESDR